MCKTAGSAFRDVDDVAKVDDDYLRKYHHSLCQCHLEFGTLPFSKQHGPIKAICVVTLTSFLGAARTQKLLERQQDRFSTCFVFPCES